MQSASDNQHHYHQTPSILSSPTHMYILAGCCTHSTESTNSGILSSGSYSYIWRQLLPHFIMPPGLPGDAALGSSSNEAPHGPSLRPGHHMRRRCQFPSSSADEDCRWRRASQPAGALQRQQRRAPGGPRQPRLHHAALHPLGEASNTAPSPCALHRSGLKIKPQPNT